MAIVSKKGPLYMTAVLGDPVTDGRADNRLAAARVYTSTERFVVSVGDSATSTYKVARLPKDAILVAPSMVRVNADAATGVSATLHLGDVNDPDGLLAGIIGAANTSYEFAPGHGGVHAQDKAGTELWSLLGYATKAAAPAQIDLFLTLNVADQVTTEGNGVVRVYYTYT